MPGTALRLVVPRSHPCQGARGRAGRALRDGTAELACAHGTSGFGGLSGDVPETAPRMTAKGTRIAARRWRIASRKARFEIRAAR